MRKWPLFKVTANINVDNITMDELLNILKKFKNNKSPGPDGIPMEFFKWLNADSLALILDLINGFFFRVAFAR